MGRCQHRGAAVGERRRKPELRARVADHRLEGDAFFSCTSLDVLWLNLEQNRYRSDSRGNPFERIGAVRH